jgi:RNA polymerase sigma-70 factor (ECF subfamily)
VCCWDAADDRVDAWAERGRLRAALAVLTDSDRELPLLVGWEGLSPAEAATALGNVRGRRRLHHSVHQRGPGQQRALMCGQVRCCRD